MPEPIDDSGPRLFRMGFDKHVHWNFGEPYFAPFDEDEVNDWLEPPDPPPFLLRELPDDLAQKIITTGDWHMKEVMSTVDTLLWRQSLRHIEHGLISAEVFDGLREVAPDWVESVAQVTLEGPFHGESGTYHLHRFRRFPEKTDGFPALVGPECRPPLEPGEYPRMNTTFMATPNPVYAYSLNFAHDDRQIMLNDAGRVVTEGFVKRWRETDISKHLRSENFEHDIDFIPSNGSTFNDAGYRWV